MGRRFRAAAVVAAAMLAGCSSAPVAEGSLLQFRRDVEARVVQVRLVAEEEGVVVRSVELLADGYPPARADPDAELPVGRPLDLRITLPPADCDEPPGAPSARLTLTGREEPVVVPLDDDGLLDRLHEGECADRALLEQTRFEVVSLEEVDGDGGPALRTVVRLSRLRGTDPVRVTDVGSNTVYVLEPVGGLPLLSDQPSGRALRGRSPSRRRTTCAAASRRSPSRPAAPPAERNRGVQGSARRVTGPQ